MNTPLLRAAYSPDPYALYAAYRATHPEGLHHDPESGLWVASNAAEVEEVFSHPSLRVRPLAEPVPKPVQGTPAGALFGGLMRQNEGPVHARGKAWAMSFLDREWPVAEAARIVVRDGASPQSAEALNRILFEAPVQLLWQMLHGTPPEGLAQQVRAVIAAWGPAADEATRQAGSDAAASLLERLQGDANRVGLFTQTCEATAGLMGAVLVTMQREPGLRERWLADPSLDEALAIEVSRHDAPTQNTRRFAAEACTLRGHRLAEGDAVLLLLASANRDPLANPDPDRFDLDRRDGRCYTWGRAGHACPGATLSRNIAMALLRCWHEDDTAGLTAMTQRWSHRVSPNGRLPQFE